MSPLAPVVVFAYNRPLHLRQTLDALSNDPLASQSELTVFCDGPKLSASGEQTQKCVDVIRVAKEARGFKKLTVVEAKSNHGLAASIIRGVSEIIQAAGQIIVLEDDLIVRPGFLEFMNRSLIQWKSDSQIFSIAGYGPAFRFPPRNETYRFPRFSSWGWATWQDRWRRVDWDVSSYPDFRRSLSARLSMARAGLDIPLMLDEQMEGRINSWAIRFAYTQFQCRSQTTFPTRSFVTNIGLDNSGTHPNTARTSSPVLSANPIVLWLFYSAGFWMSLKLFAKLVLKHLNKPRS